MKEEPESGDSARFIRQLRGFLGERPPPPTGERCELCGQPIGEPHSHLVHLERRNLLCACRPCYLLFTHGGAGGGKYKGVPERYLALGGRGLTDAQWERVQVPVDIAFFFWNSAAGRTVAFYPSPAGATESLLPLETWEEVVRANPVVAGLVPDVEALLVYKRREGFDCYIVPIDACYELVGTIRRHWRGFQGGEEAWRAIEAFFAGVRARCPQSPDAESDGGAATESAGAAAESSR